LHFTNAPINVEPQYGKGGDKADKNNNIPYLAGLSGLSVALGRYLGGLWIKVRLGLDFFMPL